MAAPQTSEELLTDHLSKPWEFTPAVNSWDKDTAKQVGGWMRQAVNAGNAVRFNQEWPGYKTQAQGKTLISTAALAHAVHHKQNLTFGGIEFYIVYKRGPKYGTLYAAHKGAPTPCYPEPAQKAIFKAIQRRAALVQYTQHEGQQQFEYHEQAKQYLITTFLSAKATAAMDAALKALEGTPTETDIGDPESAPLGAGTPPPPGIITDPGDIYLGDSPTEATAPAVTGLACTDCGEPTAVMQPCPYDSEINDNHTVLPLCAKCADLRADEL